MNLKFYRESLIPMKEGFVHHSGEDGLPYVDEHFLMVTDGLGGSGGMRHPSIVKELFNEDTIVHALFDGVYEHLDDERFASYVKKSFADLYHLKDYYAKSANALKKTSYLGSRIVSAVMIYHSLYDERLNTDKLFGEFAELEDDKKEEFLVNLGKLISDILATDLPKIAKNANIIYESSLLNRKMLVTTLCATLFKEHDDYVEAFYLVSGDSRPYAWSVSDGLRQIVPDQEGADGGMTSCIYLNDNCYVLTKYQRFAKPCVLFNASDGCFDSGAFVSPIAFEKLILETMINHDDLESAEQTFVEIFDKIGRHDDSSTLALRTFGYPTFEDYQTACAKRLLNINDNYLSLFDGLLDADYSREYEKMQILSNRRITAMKKEFEAEDAVWDYCEATVIAADPSLNEFATSDAGSSKAQDRISALKRDISDILTRDFIYFVKAIKREGVLKGCDLNSNDNLRQDILAYAKEHLLQIEDLSSDVDEFANIVKGYLQQIIDVGVPTNADDYRGIELSTALRAYHRLNQLRDFFNNMEGRGSAVVHKIYKKMQLYRKNNGNLAKEYPEILSEIVERIIKKEIDLSDSLLLKRESVQLEGLINEVNEILEEVNSIAAKQRNDRLDKIKQRYWNINVLSVILAVVNDEQSGISEELRAKVRAELDSFATESAELKQKAAKQKEILDRYFEKYSELM